MSAVHPEESSHPIVPSSDWGQTDAQAPRLPSSSDPKPLLGLHAKMSTRKIPDLQRPHFHVFLSYRVATEGEKGNNFTAQLYNKILMSSQTLVKLPQSGSEAWPEHIAGSEHEYAGGARVFYDKKGLQSGQMWRESFITALAHSLIVVPILSWIEPADQGSGGHGGSLGRLMNLSESDAEDNVLLEIIVGLELLKSATSFVRAIVPVFLGQQDPKKKTFQEATVYRNVSKLPDICHLKTYDLAARFLKMLGVAEAQIASMKKRTVKETIGELLQFHGIKLGQYNSLNVGLEQTALEILRAVKRETGMIWKNQLQEWSEGHPHSQEVLEWLNEHNLAEYAKTFALHRLNSLRRISQMTHDDATRIVEDHVKSQGSADSAMVCIGETKHMFDCIQRLAADERAQTLAYRLHHFTDSRVPAYTAMVTTNGLELVLGRPGGLFSITPIGLFFLIAGGGLFLTFSVQGAEPSRGRVSEYLALVMEILLIVTLHGATALAAVLFSVSRCPHEGQRVFMAGTLITTALHVVFTVGMWVQCVSPSGIVSEACTNSMMWAISIPVTGALIGWAYVTVYKQEWMWIVLFGAIATMGTVLGACFVGWDRRVISGEYDDFRWMFTTGLAFSIFGWLSLFTVVILIHRMRRVKQRAELKLKTITQKYAAITTRLNFREIPDTVASTYIQNRLERQLQWAKSIEQARPWSLQRSVPLVWGGKFLQRRDDMEQLFSHAEYINDAFQEFIEQFVVNHCASTTSFEIVRGPVKHPARAMEKVVRTYHRNTASLTDLVRSTVVFDDIHKLFDFLPKLFGHCVVDFIPDPDSSSVYHDLEIGEAEAEPLNPQLSRHECWVSGCRWSHRMHKRFGKFSDQRLSTPVDQVAKPFRITGMKNRFENDADSDGFRNVHLNLEVAWTTEGGRIVFHPVSQWSAESSNISRHICEVQLHVRDYFDVLMGGEHKAYAEWRNLVCK